MVSSHYYEEMYTIDILFNFRVQVQFLKGAQAFPERLCWERGG